MFEVSLQKYSILIPVLGCYCSINNEALKNFEESGKKSRGKHGSERDIENEAS